MQLPGVQCDEWLLLGVPSWLLRRVVVMLPPWIQKRLDDNQRRAEASAVEVRKVIEERAADRAAFEQVAPMIRDIDLVDPDFVEKMDALRGRSTISDEMIERLMRYRESSVKILGRVNSPGLAGFAGLGGNEKKKMA